MKLLLSRPCGRASSKSRKLAKPLEGLAPGVASVLCADMLHQVTPHAEAMAALEAGVGPLARVRPDVHLQLRVGDEGPRAEGAGVRSDGRVPPDDVLRQAVLVLENGAAGFALKVPLRVGGGRTDVLAVVGGHGGSAYAILLTILLLPFFSIPFSRRRMRALILVVLCLLLRLLLHTVLHMGAQVTSILEGSLTTVLTAEKAFADVVRLYVIH